MVNHDTIKQRICKLLGMTEEQYARHQYDTGLAYLQLYLHGTEPATRELEGNRIFWNWWKNLWALRDLRFLQDQHQGNHWAIWLNSHDAAMLAAERTAPARLMGSSYAVMIGKLIKAEVANG